MTRLHTIVRMQKLPNITMHLISYSLRLPLPSDCGHAEIYPSTLWKTLDMYIPAIYGVR
jgi:hypothetical protein